MEGARKGKASEQQGVCRTCGFGSHAAVARISQALEIKAGEGHPREVRLEASRVVCTKIED